MNVLPVQIAGHIIDSFLLSEALELDLDVGLSPPVH